MSCHYRLRELKRVWLIHGELLSILHWCIIGLCMSLYFLNQLILSMFFE